MSKDRANYLPSPLALFKLDVFGGLVRELIGDVPYLVGSVHHKPDYRDVDIRIMLDDERFEAIFGGDGLWITNDALKLFNMALSALAREMTGLEIDCQFQRRSDANKEYGGEPRRPLMHPSHPTTKGCAPSPLLQRE